MEVDMHVEKLLRLVAGVVILLSLLLVHFVSTKWLLLTAVVGLNLVQSFFTDWCPMMSLLERLGVRRCQ